MKCSFVNSDRSLALANNKKSNDTYEVPWNAAVFSDGEYQCMGVILNEKWAMTSFNCFDGILQ